MANPQQPAGEFGENIAAAQLEQHGFRVIARNFRSRFGEIDLIAGDERFLLFVEVKTRGHGSRYAGEEAVDFRKQTRLRRTAELYLSTHQDQRQPRFDVICVDLAGDGQVKAVRWVENAF